MQNSAIMTARGAVNVVASYGAAVAGSRIAEHVMGRERSPERVGPTHEDEPAVADP
jgi:hypothetical protein